MECLLQNNRIKGREQLEAAIDETQREMHSIPGRALEVCPK
jgi:hypothetical protein